MSNFDQSRLADLQGIDEKLSDPHTSRVGKRRLERSRAAILRQEHDPYVKSMRNRLLKATQANDPEEIERINERLMRYDQSHGYDQHESGLAKPK